MIVETKLKEKTIINNMTVIVPKDVYLTIVASSVRFANMRIPREEWALVSGLLVGKNVGNDVILTKTYPIMHQKVHTVGKFSDEDYEALNFIDDEAFSKGLYVVGWWHSSPGFKVMLSSVDIQTMLNYQRNNPLAITMIFSPIRLTRQEEVANKQGDPQIPIKNDPGFKIFRLDDTDSVELSYHTVDYKIEGYDSQEQIVRLTTKFIVDVTNFFPKENIVHKYEKYIEDRISKLDMMFLGTKELLTSLNQRGMNSMIPEVKNNQSREIQKLISDTFDNIEFIKKFMESLEFKERDKIPPKVKEILTRWTEFSENSDVKLKTLKM